MNFADRIRCPALVSCGLDDEAVPPECIFAAYNRISAAKEIEIYPFGRHCIEPWQAEKTAWLRDKLFRRASVRHARLMLPQHDDGAARQALVAPHVYPPRNPVQPGLSSRSDASGNGPVLNQPGIQAWRGRH